MDIAAWWPCATAQIMFSGPQAASPPKKILEIGVYNGRRSLQMIEAAKIFNKDIFYKMKGFDERFFLYFEDTDFCLKLNKSDFMVVYFPEAKIKHFKNRCFGS